MNFLKKAQEQAKNITDKAPAAPGVKPAVPGAKPNIPAGKPNIPGAKPNIPGSKPNIPGAKPNIPGAKPNIPGSKPTIPGKAPQAPVAKEEPKTPLQKSGNPFLKKTEAPKVAPETKIEEDVEITAPIPAVETTTIKEEVKAPAPVEETKVEAKEEVKETTPADTKETPKEEEKPKKKTSRSKAKKKEEPKDTEADNASEAKVALTQPTITKTEVDYAEAMLAIKSGFVDNEWEEFRADIIARLDDISIASDMNTTALKQTISDLSALRESIWVIYNDTKTAYEKLTAKEPEGLIERIKKINSQGSNAEERKYNAIMAVMNYKDDAGRKINLFELLDETRERYNFLKSVMDSSQYKTNVLVTMLGSLKLEK